MKILVAGYGRHGKDTFCELLGVPFLSASWAALEHVIWPQWGADHYETMEECFEDRHNERTNWFKSIKKYNEIDKTKLAREILSECDVYCGMRNHEELIACDESNLFDLKIWVDASKRLPPEDTSSCTITPDMCDIVVDNNGTLTELKKTVEALRESLLKRLAA